MDWYCTADDDSYFIGSSLRFIWTHSTAATSYTHLLYKSILFHVVCDDYIASLKFNIVRIWYIVRCINIRLVRIWYYYVYVFSVYFYLKYLYISLHCIFNPCIAFVSSNYAITSIPGRFSQYFRKDVHNTNVIKFRTYEIWYVYNNIAWLSCTCKRSAVAT